MPGPELQAFLHHLACNPDIHTGCRGRTEARRQLALLEIKLLFSVSCLNVSQFLEAWDGKQTLPLMGGRDLVPHGHAGQREGTSFLWLCSALCSTGKVQVPL